MRRANANTQYLGALIGSYKLAIIHNDFCFLKWFRSEQFTSNSNLAINSLILIVGLVSVVIFSIRTQYESVLEWWVYEMRSGAEFRVFESIELIVILSGLLLFSGISGMSPGNIHRLGQSCYFHSHVGSIALSHRHNNNGRSIVDHVTTNRFSFQSQCLVYQSKKNHVIF